MAFTPSSSPTPRATLVFALSRVQRKGELAGDGGGGTYFGRISRGILYVDVLLHVLSVLPYLFCIFKHTNIACERGWWGLGYLDVRGFVGKHESGGGPSDPRKAKPYSLALDGAWVDVRGVHI